MNTSILTPILGSMLAMAPIVDSTLNFSSELKRPVLSEKSLVVHEWGTFTALQGSDGSVTNGMQHEEESLPSFVHSRYPLDERQPLPPGVRPCPRFCKGFEPGTLFNSSSDLDHLVVTQKMETPVLYFYSKDAIKNVNVNVGFPRGIISQYYPAPASFSPEIDNVKEIANGNVSFNFDIAAENEILEIPPVEAESVYAPSRQVAANYIRNSHGEAEKLIFYRGLGNFQTSISVTSDRSGVTIRNTSKSLATQSGILFYTNGGVAGGFLTVGSLAPSASVFFTYDQINSLKEYSSPGLVERVSAQLVQQLEQSGLYHDEAVAMANTWKRSYFKTPGLRFLHILSRAETESLLPLSISVEPSELVRTMVGRIEIMTYQDEQQLIAEIAMAGDSFKVESLGRLAEAKLRRVRDLVPKGFATDIDDLIARAIVAQ